MTNRQCLQLDDYLDGLLEPANREAFERHLDKCDGCRQAVLFEQAMLTAETAAIDDVVVPASVTANAESEIRRWQLKCRLVWTAGFAAALLAGLFGFAMRDSVIAPDIAKSIRPEIAIDSDPPQGVPPGLHAESVSQEPGGNDRRPTTVRIRSGDRPRQVALALPTQTETVTLVMVFPTTFIDRVNVPEDKPSGADAGN